MLRVTVDLLTKEEDKQLTTIHVVNTGIHNEEGLANYTVREMTTPFRRGRVGGFNRALGPWPLVKRALEEILEPDAGHA